MLVFVALAAVPARAGSTVVLSAGDCAEAALIEGAKTFREAAAPRFSGTMLDGAQVLDIVRPRPSRSIDELLRQLESGKTLFFSGQNERALDLVTRALSDLARVTPDAQPWPHIERALVLQAQIYRNLGATRDMNEAFRLAVRINPALTLDPEVHAPSLIAALDVVKKEVQRAKKAPLTVRADAGRQVQVAIDGKVLGVTPLKVELLPGTYRVTLVDGNAVSFPHRVELPRENELSVEFGFEASVSRRPPLCLSAADDSGALKLSQLIGAELLVVLRTTNGGAALQGTSYDVATAAQVRHGAVNVERIANLATFLATGEAQPGIEGAIPPPEPPVVTADEPRAAPQPAQGGFFTPGRVAGVVLLATGVVAGVGAGVSFGVMADFGVRRSAYQQPLSQRRQAELDELNRSYSTAAAAGMVLAIAGGAALITGTIFMFVFSPQQGPVLSLAPTADGGLFVLTGSF